jgi:N6-L-threonylcarbamoyladenine synthase
MLNLGYPGGKVISDLASDGNPDKIKFPRPYLDKNEFNFSFSGLKSAVNRYIQTHPDEYQSQAADIAAAFQASVVDVLTYKIIAAAREKKCRHVALVGGVAANRQLRENITASAEKYGLKAFLPSVELCGDNAAMIAATGYYYLNDPARSAGELSMDVYSRAAKKK